MKKFELSERILAMGLARMWNTLDPSHFAQYLNPITERHSFWEFESIKGKDRIIDYYASKVEAARSARDAGGKVVAEVCATRMGPFVFSSSKSPQALAKAQEMEDKSRSPQDSFCVLLKQETPTGEKNDILITFEIDRGLLTKYCYSHPGLFRYRPLGVMPGITAEE
jgi:hypothetical protein